jgi:hypothetical protein
LYCVYAELKINNFLQAIQNAPLDERMPGINQALHCLHEDNRSSGNVKPLICAIYYPS